MITLKNMLSRKEKSELDFEIQFCEGLLKKNPSFVEALSVLGDAYTKRGMYEKGLVVDEKLSQLKPSDATVLYNLACSYSLLNKIDLAYRTIKQALRRGYDHFEYLENDSDLANLRMDARFQRYWERLKARIGDNFEDIEEDLEPYEG